MLAINESMSTEQQYMWLVIRRSQARQCKKQHISVTQLK